MADVAALFIALVAVTAAACVIMAMTPAARRKRRLAAAARKRRTSLDEGELADYLGALDQAKTPEDIDRLEKGEG